MGETIEAIKETGKDIARETISIGTQIVVGACNGVRYLFGRPFPKE